MLKTVLKWRAGCRDAVSSMSNGACLSLSSKRVRMSHQLFYLAYGIWLSAAILNTSLWFPYDNDLNKLIRVVAILVLVVYELTIVKELHYSIVACILAALVIVGAVMGRNLYVIEAASFVLCATKVSFDRIAQLTCVCLSVSILLVLIPVFCGLLDNPLIGISRPRYTLGFKQPPYLSHYLFVLSSLVLWLRRESISVNGILALALCNMLVFAVTDSRNSFILIWLLLIIGILGKYFKLNSWRNLIFKIIVGSFFGALSFGAISISALYDPSTEWMLDSDRLLSARLSLGNRAISEYGITLFGQDVSFNGNAWTSDGFNVVEDLLVVDSSYLNIAVSQGLVTLLIIVFCYTIIVAKLLKEQEVIRALVIVALAVHSCIDGQLLFLQYDPFLFLIAGLLPGLGLGRKASQSLRLLS